MKSKKNLLKLFAYSITSIVIIFTLSACSFGHKKAYYQLIDEENRRDTRVTVEANFDKISSTKCEMLISFNDFNLDDSTKQLFKTELETQLSDLKKRKGVTVKVSQTDDYLKTELTVDYSKTDLKELKENDLLPSSISDKDNSYHSFKKIADIMKKLGFSEVKDGKFKEFK